MSEPSRKTYRPWEPQRYRQEAQSPEAKLPEGDVVFLFVGYSVQAGFEPFLCVL